MSRIRAVQCCIVWAACWLTPVHAQSIDPSAAALALHRPFSLQLPVRTADALPVQTLARCVDAEFQSGSTLLFSDQMKVSLRPSPRDGWQLLVFEHPHVVQEPALLAHVVLRCPARFEREFIVQAEEPAPGAAPGQAMATRVAESAPRRAPPATTSHAAIPASAPRGLAPAPAPLPTPTTPTPLQAPHPVPAATAMAAVNPDQLRDEILRLQAALAAAQLGSGKGTAAPADRTPAPAPSPAVADASLLEVTPAALRADPTLLVGAALLAALLPLLRWWRHRCRLPRLQTMDIAQPAGAPVPSEPPPPSTAPPARVSSAPCVILEESPERVDLIPPTAIPPGAASLADREAARFTHQVRGLVNDGYLDAAIGLLEKTLAATPARNPWLMLQLLDLYETMGETGLAARLIGELQTLYRVQLPTIDGVACRGRSLQDMPALLQEVAQAWEADDVAELLEDLIHRSPGPTWDLATFQDLLLLHAVAIDRAPAGPAPLPNAVGAFEPVLEWSVDEP